LHFSYCLGCLECPDEFCGPKVETQTTRCADNSTSGFTGKCLYDARSQSCQWEYRRCDDCALVDCAQPGICPEGSGLIKHGCCSVCLNCSQVACLSVTCASGYESYVPDGSCCPSCRLKAECGPVCEIFCPYGNVFDVQGCPTCECNPQPVCQPRSCDAFCPYGNMVDEVGCPTCACNPNPQCGDITCSPCPERSMAIYSNDSCCPHCISCPAAEECSQQLCAIGFELKTLPGQCCPSCVPKLDCSAVLCASVFSCPSGQVRVKKGCCEVCEPAVPCDNVRCFIFDCPANTKKVYPDGSCCPTCLPIPNCTLATCTTQSCPPGSELVHSDLECCPSCLPIGRCANVLCARPSCESALWITRSGECCPQCPTCTASSDGRTTCDGNDNEVCVPGYFTGELCEDPVPPSDRDEVSIRVELCPCPEGSDALKEAYTERRVAGLANVDLKYVDVVLQASGATAGCCAFEVSIFSSKSDSSVSPTQAQNQFISKVQGASDIRLASTNNSSAAATAASAFVLVLLTVISILF
jgi:hypothetical protein